MTSLKWSIKTKSETETVQQNKASVGSNKGGRDESSICLLRPFLVFLGKHSAFLENHALLSNYMHMYINIYIYTYVCIFVYDINLCIHVAMFI